jgi:RNA binding exosome subunit
MQNTLESNTEVSDQPIFNVEDIPCVNISNPNWADNTFINWDYSIEIDTWKIELEKEKHTVEKYGNKVVVMEKKIDKSSYTGDMIDSLVVYVCDDYTKDKTFKTIYNQKDKKNEIFIQVKTTLWGSVFVTETKNDTTNVNIDWESYVSDFGKKSPIFMMADQLLFEGDYFYSISNVAGWSLSKYKINRIEKKIISLGEENTGIIKSHKINGIQIILQNKDRNEYINDIRRWEEWVWKNPIISNTYPIKESWREIYAVGKNNCLYCDDKKISEPVPSKFADFRDFSVGGNKLILTFSNKFIQFDLPLMNNEEETSNNNHILMCNAIIDDNGNKVFTEKNSREWLLKLKMGEFEHEILDVWEIIELSIDKGIITIIYKEKSTGKEIHKKISLNPNAKAVKKEEEKKAMETTRQQGILNLTKGMTPENLSEMLKKFWENNLSELWEMLKIVKDMTPSELKKDIADAGRLQWLETRLQNVSEGERQAKQEAQELKIKNSALEKENKALEELVFELWASSNFFLEILNTATKNIIKWWSTISEKNLKIFERFIEDTRTIALWKESNTIKSWKANRKQWWVENLATALLSGKK